MQRTQPPNHGSVGPQGLFIGHVRDHSDADSGDDFWSFLSQCLGHRKKTSGTQPRHDPIRHSPPVIIHHPIRPPRRPRRPPPPSSQAPPPPLKRPFSIDNRPDLTNTYSGGVNRGGGRYGKRHGVYIDVEAEKQRALEEFQKNGTSSVRRRELMIHMADNEHADYSNKNPIHHDSNNPEGNPP